VLQLGAVLFTSEWFSDASDVEKKSQLGEIRRILNHFQDFNIGLLAAELVLDEEMEKQVSLFWICISSSKGLDPDRISGG
jgi:hypothetical protein